MSTEVVQQPKKPTLLDLIQHAEALEESTGSVPDEMLEELKAEALLVLNATKDKIDGYAGMVSFHMKRAACASGELKGIPEPAGEGKFVFKGGVMQEVERLKRRIAREEASADRLRILALFVIRTIGKDSKGKWRKLEGEKATLKAVSVADSCEVYDQSLIPSEYKDATIAVTMPAEDWLNARAGYDEECDTISIGHPETFALEYSVNKKKLLAALQETCERCKGEGKTQTKALYGDEPMSDQSNGVDTHVCAKCNGKGTKLIPGARLLTDKLRLVIE